jgi:hypothetical protein
MSSIGMTFTTGGKGHGEERVEKKGYISEKVMIYVSPGKTFAKIIY